MSFKRYNGSAWVDVETVKRYNGSAWVDCEAVKRYTGSAWVDVWPNAHYLWRSGTGAMNGGFSWDGCSLVEDGTTSFTILANDRASTTYKNTWAISANAIDLSKYSKICLDCYVDMEYYDTDDGLWYDHSGSPNTSTGYIQFRVYNDNTHATIITTLRTRHIATVDISDVTGSAHIDVRAEHGHETNNRRNTATIYNWWLE